MNFNTMLTIHMAELTEISILKIKIGEFIISWSTTYFSNNIEVFLLEFSLDHLNLNF